MRISTLIVLIGYCVFMILITWALVNAVERHHHQKIVTQELDKFDHQIVYSPDGKTLKPLIITKEQKKTIDRQITGIGPERFFIEEECGFSDTDTIFYSIPKIAQCISIRNQIIANQTKALLWGLR